MYARTWAGTCTCTCACLCLCPVSVCVVCVVQCMYVLCRAGAGRLVNQSKSVEWPIVGRLRKLGGAPEGSRAWRGALSLVCYVVCAVPQTGQTGETGKPFADLARLVSGMGLTNDSRWDVPGPNSRIPGPRLSVLGAGRWLLVWRQQSGETSSNSNWDSSSDSKWDQPLRSGCEMGAMQSRAGWTGRNGHDMHACKYLGNNERQSTAG